MAKAGRTFESEVLERLARIEERQLISVDLPTRVNSLEQRQDKAEGFMYGAKWAFAFIIGAISFGFIKVGFGDAVASVHDIVKQQ